MRKTSSSTIDVQAGSKLKVIWSCDHSHLSQYIYIYIYCEGNPCWECCWFSDRHKIL